MLTVTRRLFVKLTMTVCIVILEIISEILYQVDTIFSESRAVMSGRVVRLLVFNVSLKSS